MADVRSQANIDSLVKRKYHPKPKEDPEHVGAASANTLPITHCPVFVRIQPVIAPLPLFSAGSAPPKDAVATDPSSAMPGTAIEEEKHLFFIVLLRDPSNELSHATLSQSMPASWLDVPFEENEWVEDVMVEVIRRATEVSSFWPLLWFSLLTFLPNADDRPAVRERPVDRSEHQEHGQRAGVDRLYAVDDQGRRRGSGRRDGDGRTGCGLMPMLAVPWPCLSPCTNTRVFAFWPFAILRRSVDSAYLSRRT